MTRVKTITMSVLLSFLGEHSSELEAYTLISNFLLCPLASDIPFESQLL